MFLCKGHMRSSQSKKKNDRLFILEIVFTIIIKEYYFLRSNL